MWRRKDHQEWILDAIAKIAQENKEATERRICRKVCEERGAVEGDVREFIDIAVTRKKIMRHVGQDGEVIYIDTSPSQHVHLDPGTAQSSSKGRHRKKSAMQCLLCNKGNKEEHVCGRLYIHETDEGEDGLVAAHKKCMVSVG